MKRLIVGVAIALLVAGAQAQVPRVLSYQGILTDSEGRILPDGEYHLTIRLYDRLEATEPLYVEEHRAVAVRGVVNVLIGTVEPLPWRLAFDRVYYVGVSVNGSEELRPRTMLTAVPYALRAETATVADVAKTVAPEALKGVTVQTTPSGPAGGDLSGTYPNPTIGSSRVTTVKIATGAVTTDKLANSSVTTVKIADNAVTTAKITNGAVTYGKLQNAAGTNRLLVSGSGGAWGELSAPTTSGQVLTYDGSGLAWQSVSGTVPNGSAAGQLLLWNGSAWTAQTMSGDATINASGTLTITNDAVTSAKIADGTIVDADISSTANIAVGKLAVTQNNLIVGNSSGVGSLLAPGSDGQVLTIVGGAPAWANVSVTETDPVWTAAEPNYGNLTQNETVTGTWTFSNPISGSITGNAGTATALQTARDFSLSGDVTASAVSFNGTANVTLTTTIADGAVTSAKIADNAVTTAKLANGAVTDAKVSDVAWTKITGAPTSFPPSGAAGGDLTGTYPNPSIANDAVTSAKIADGTIVDADISPTANIAVSKLAVTQNNLIVGNSSGVGSLLAPGSNGQVLTIVGGAPAWANVSVTETDPVWTAAEPNYGNLTQNETVTGTWTFSNPISGSITGNAGTATALQTARDFSLSGDVTASAVSFNGTANVTLTTTIADGAVTSAKIADNAVTTAKLANGAVTDAKVSDVAWTKITGAPTSFPPSGAAGGDLTGTYPNPSIANDAVTSAKIADGTIVDADISSTANIAVGKLAVTQNNLIVGNSSGVGSLLAPGTNGQVLTIVGGVPQWQSLPPVTETDPEVSMTAVGAVPRWNGTALVNGSLSDDGNGVLSRTGDIAINPGSTNLLLTNGSLMVGGSATISGNANLNSNLLVGGSTTLGSASENTPTMIQSQDNTNAALTVLNSGTGGLVELVGTGGGNAIKLAKPTLSDNRVWTLPDLTGTVTVYTNSPALNQVLTWTTNGPQWQSLPTVTETDPVWTAAEPNYGNLTQNETVTGTWTFSNPISGSITGNAGTATALQTARDFSLSGDVTASAVSFNGTANVTLTTTIADGAVTSAKIADNAVTTAKLANGAVTDAKVSDVAWTKITGAPTSFPPSGAAGGDLTGTYPNPSIANDAVTSAKIADGTIVDADISSTANIAVGKLAVTQNNLIVGNSSGVGSLLAPGTNGQVLTIVGGVPQWQSLPPVTETDPEVSMTAVGAVPRWDGTALVDGSLSDNGSGVLSRAGDIAINPGGSNTLSTDGSLIVSGSATIGGTANVNSNLSVGGSTTLGSASATTPTTIQSQDNTNAALTVLNSGMGGLVELVGTGGGNAIKLAKPTLSDNRVWTLPDLTGTVTVYTNSPALNQVLTWTTNGPQWQSLPTVTETDPVWTAAEPNYGNLTQNETVTGTWTFSNPISGSITGNAGTATALQTARDFSLSGDVTASAVSFNGTANVTLTTTIADGAVTSAKIADNAVTTAKLANGAVTDAKVGDVAWTKITGAPTSFPPSGAAGGDLTGTYPNPSIANDAVTSAKIADGTIVDADISSTANIAVGKLAVTQNNLIVGNSSGVGSLLAPGSDGQVLTIVGGAPAWANVSVTETDPEVSMTAVGAVPRWNGTALVNGSLSDNGSGVLSRAGDIAINPGGSNTLSTDGSLMVGGSATISGAATVNQNLSVGGSTTLGSASANTSTTILSDGAGAALDVVNYGSGPAIEVTGNIQPSSSATYDLGSPTNEWQTIYTADAIISGNATVNTKLNVGGDATFGTPTSSITVQVLSNTGGNALEIVNYGSGPALLVGANGNGIKEIMHGTVSVDPPAINANSSGTLTVTITGVSVGDRVFLTPPNDLEDELIFQGAAVTGADTVTIKIRNVSGSNVDGASRTWHYLVIKP